MCFAIIDSLHEKRNLLIADFARSSRCCCLRRAWGRCLPWSFVFWPSLWIPKILWPPLQVIYKIFRFDLFWVIELNHIKTTQILNYVKLIFFPILIDTDMDTDTIREKLNLMPSLRLNLLLTPTMDTMDTVWDTVDTTVLVTTDTPTGK